MKLNLQIQYDSVGAGNPKIVTNLLRRVAVRAKVKTNTLMFDTYDVKEGETPEIIADKFYDDPQLHWVIMLVNNVTDRYHDWPMNEQQFSTFVNEKYSNPDGIHHYEITQESGDTKQKIEVYDPIIAYNNPPNYLVMSVSHEPKESRDSIQWIH